MQNIPKDIIIKASEGNMGAFEEIYKVNPVLYIAWL